MAEFSPHAEKAPVGALSIDGADYLAVKLSSRKNPTFGVILKRPFFCGMGNAMARLNCPVHSLWPAVKARVPPGEKLFVAVKRRNFNRNLKATLTGLSVPQAARYSPHAFTRGSPKEMNETRPPHSEIALLVHGAPMQCSAISIWRLAWKRTRANCSARTSTPNRKRRHHHFVGIGRKIPIGRPGAGAFPEGIWDSTGLSRKDLVMNSSVLVKRRSEISGGWFFGIRMGTPKPEALRPLLPTQTTSGAAPPLLFGD